MQQNYKFVNTQEYQRVGQFYLKNGYYTDAPENSPDWEEFWDREVNRCLNGYSVGGVQITGYHYFYLNYVLIPQVYENKDATGENGAADWGHSLPKFWDGDYNYFWAVEIARYGCSDEFRKQLEPTLGVNILDWNGGKHMVTLKTRGVGYSWKSASMLARNYYLKRGSKNYAMASKDDYLTKGDALLNKTWEILSFNDTYSAWGQPRLINKMMHKQSGYEDVQTGAYKGFMSQIIGVIVNDAEKARGKRGELIKYEEAGSFKELLRAWEINRPSVEQGKYTVGLQEAFGCVCAGTKVWNNNGDLVNIENLNKDEGVLGYDGNGYNKEDIVWMKPPAKKPCYRITTKGQDYIECSHDHPLMWSKDKWKRNKNDSSKAVNFTTAENIEVGDQLMMIEKVPEFGTLNVPEARLLGLMIGDGNYSKNCAPQLSVGDGEIFDYVNKNYNCKTYKTFDTSNGGVFKSLGIKDSKNLLVDNKMYGQVKLKKRLPHNISEYDKESLCEILGGYFDADGNVYFNKKKNCIRIVLTSICYPLLEEVKYQLIKLGIHSSIHKEFRGKKEEKISDNQLDHVYRLYVSKSCDVKKFREEISFLCDHKQETLEKIDNIPFRAQGQVKRAKFLINPDNNKGSFFKGKNDLTDLRITTVSKVEYIGEQYVYNMHTGHSNTYLSNGFVTKQTGGEEGSDFESLQELFHNPEAYNVLPFENIWDQEGGVCGWFVPCYVNREGYMDENGNSLMEEADNAEMKEREAKRAARNTETLQQRIAEHPRNPKEATLSFDKNNLPISELKDQKQHVLAHNLHRWGTKGWLVRNKEGIRFKIDSDAPTVPYGHKKDDNLNAGVVIYEAPHRDQNGKVPRDLYMILHDPYDHDDSTSHRPSIGAAYVLKLPNPYSKPDDIIVAKYVARPQTANIYNDTLFKLAEYYNVVGKLAFENDRGKVIDYAKHNEQVYRLMPELDIVDKSAGGGLKRGFGFSVSTPQKKQQAELMGRDWLLEPRGKTLEEEQLMNLNYIYDVELLEALINYDPDKNNDRASAFLGGISCRESMYQRVNEVEEAATETSNSFFNRPFFSG